MLRFLGMAIRVYTAGQVGAQGMGLYQLIVSVYSFFVTIASSGLSVAVTRLVAAKPGCSSRILRKAVTLGLLVSIPSAIALFFLSPVIGFHMIGDARVIAPLKILSFSLPCIALTSCTYGYFLARRKVIKSCTSQIVEQAVRISAIMALFSLIPSGNLELACCVLCIGTVLSEGISCLFAYILYKVDAKAQNPSRETPAIWRPMLKITGPIALTAWLRSGLFTLENLLIPKGFAKFGGSSAGAIAQYGVLKGMAIPIIFFPAAFLAAISRLLIPEITEASVKKQTQGLRSTVARTMRLTIICSIFFGAVFLLFSNQISLAIYKDTQSAYLMFLLAPLIPFMYAETMADSLLKGLDEQVYSLRYNLFDAGARIFLIWILLPLFGMRGFIMVLYCSNIFCCLFSVGKLISITKVKLDIINWLLKPILAATVACLAALAMFGHLSSLMTCLIAIPTAGVLFFFILLLLRAIHSEELKRIRR